MSVAIKSSGEAARHALPAALIHDLRSPLNSIIGYTELLIEQMQEQGRENFVPDLERTHLAGKQILAIINEHFYPIGPVKPEATLGASGEKRSGQIKHEGSSEPQKAGEQATAVAQGRILVVDDIEANRDVLSRQLKRRGYAVSTAENGREALETLSAASFDLVLLDIMMPEMDGYEVLKRLKADEVLRHIPIVMISALSELESVVHCIELGAEDYLPKPFNPTLLRARIGACLEKKRAHDREILLFEQLQENHRRVKLFAAALHIKNEEMASWRTVHEADLAVARTTQQGIVNSAPPQLEGWQVESLYTPLIQVGGDVYGWLPIERDVWVFWLADATGHGVSAALFTSLIALLFEHASFTSRTAHGILRQVNTEFHNAVRGNSFMTACCVIIQADGQLTYTGAGHPPLLIRRRDGTVETLPSLNSIMGFDSAMEIKDTTTTLGSGDVALLYSDGLYSLKSRDGERHTLDTLTETFAQNGNGADSLPNLIGSLLLQSDGRPFDDDVAAIVLHRT